MCGRISQTKDLKKFAGRLNILENEIPKLKSRYNVAPSQEVVVIIQEKEQRPTIAQFKWGLVPSWAKDMAIGNRMINARAETLTAKPSFRGPLRRQRCLVPADGFYEWKKQGRSKVPYYIRMKSGEPFAFAGLWSLWIAPNGSELRTFTIVTTEPNDLMKTIHHRMPVIFPEDAERVWLDPKRDDSKELESLLVPYPSDKLEAYPVSTLVNSPANDLPECMAPVRSLF